MNITPRSRDQRSLIKDNDAVVRKKLEEEHSRHYRSPALIENHITLVEHLPSKTMPQ